MKKKTISFDETLLETMGIITLKIVVDTDVQISLRTLLVKYYNDLLGRQSSERAG